MNRACSTQWRDEICIQNFFREPERKRALQRPRRRWEVNIRTDLRETGRKSSRLFQSVL
jgi:hypothetical protein